VVLKWKEIWRTLVRCHRSPSLLKRSNHGFLLRVNALQFFCNDILELRDDFILIVSGWLSKILNNSFFYISKISCHLFHREGILVRTSFSDSYKLKEQSSCQLSSILQVASQHTYFFMTHFGCFHSIQKGKNICRKLYN
jgi:hypothetical protein